MPNQILTREGEYLTPFFEGVNGVWRLIGTETGGKKATEAIDTFRNTLSGEFKEVVRSSVYIMADRGDIHPIGEISEAETATSITKINLFNYFL